MCTQKTKEAKRASLLKELGLTGNETCDEERKDMKKKGKKRNVTVTSNSSESKRDMKER